MNNAYGPTPPIEHGWYWIRNKHGGTCVAHRVSTQEFADEWYHVSNKRGDWGNRAIRDADLVAEGYQFGPRVTDPTAWPEGAHRGGITLDLVDVTAMISRAVGSPVEDIMLEQIAVKQDRKTGRFDGEIGLRSMKGGKRYSLKFFGDMETTG